MTFVPGRLEKTADISRGDRSWQSFLGNTASVLIVLVLGYLALGALGELLARSIPDRWEARVFASREADAAAGDDRVPGFTRAEEIFGRLIEHEGLRALPYRLLVLPLDQPNAFALPGGEVGVTRGLLEEVDSETGLALVLAHELGHHQERHTLKRISRTLVFGLARGLLFGRSTASVTDSSLYLAESGYSRRQETAADAFGLRLVRQVYGDTCESLELFEGVLVEANTEGSDWAAFFRSHPATGSRVEELRRLQESLGERCE